MLDRTQNLAVLRGTTTIYICWRSEAPPEIDTGLTFWVRYCLALVRIKLERGYLEVIYLGGQSYFDTSSCILGSDVMPCRHHSFAIFTKYNTQCCGNSDLEQLGWSWWDVWWAILFLWYCLFLIDCLRYLLLGRLWFQTYFLRNRS